MIKPDKILIQTNKSIKNALSQLTKTKEKLLICIDKSKKFVGVINDGDIRRAMLKGAKLNVKIEKYVNKKSTFVTNQITEQEASKLVTSRIVVLPVINSFQNVVGYYSFKGKEQNFNVISNEIAVILIILFIILNLILYRHRNMSIKISQMPLWQWFFFILTITLLIFLTFAGHTDDFIYFQF